MSQKTLPPNEIRRAMNTLIIGQSFGAPLPQVLLNGGVFSLLILQLGGNKFEVGLVFMLNFLSQTIRVFSARYADIRDTRKMFVLWCFISNIVFLPIFLAGFIRAEFGNQMAVWYVCAIYFAQRLTVNVAGTAWQPLVAHIIPTVMRGRFTGAMRRYFQITSLSMIVLAGFYLGDEPSLPRFSAVFAVLLTLSVVRPLFIARAPRREVVPGARPEKLSRNMARPFRDRQFRHFLLFWAYLVFAITIARPFTVPFLKLDLGLPSSITIYSSSLLVLGMAISLLRWGRLADRLGNRLVFLLNIFVMAFAFLLLAFAPKYESSPILAICLGASAVFAIGISVGGLGIAHTVRTLNVAPDQFRGSYMSAFFIVNGIVAGIVSTLSGLLLDAVPDSIVLFGQDVLFMRIYFPIASILVLSTIPSLLRVKPISGRSMRETVSIFAESLPSVISLPLQAVRVIPKGDIDTR